MEGAPHGLASEEVQPGGTGAGRAGGRTLRRGCCHLSLVSLKGPDEAGYRSVGNMANCRYWNPLSSQGEAQLLGGGWQVPGAQEGVCGALSYSLWSVCPAGAAGKGDNVASHHEPQHGGLEAGKSELITCMLGLWELLVLELVLDLVHFGIIRVI